MTKTKHTPGPWRYDRQNPGPTTGEHMIAGSLPGYLAEVRDCGSGDAQANARLIAAAPDLFDLLYYALPCVEESEEFDKPTRPKLSAQIRALIKTIEGE